MPCRESRYAIRRPSGEKLGSNCGPGAAVRRRTREPSARATKTSRKPAPLYAIVPAGRGDRRLPDRTTAPTPIRAATRPTAPTRFHIVSLSDGPVVGHPVHGFVADRIFRDPLRNRRARAAKHRAAARPSGAHVRAPRRAHGAAWYIGGSRA